MSHRLLPNQPAWYHGKNTSRPYFEGWYFKHTSGRDAFSVIPGVFRDKEKSGDTAFIQVIFGSPPKSHFIPYPYSTFRHSRRPFSVQIGGSFFSLDKVLLDIKEIDLKAELSYKQQVPLETSFLSPNIMGPFAYMPAMQCNHGVLSLTHRVGGMLRIGEQNTLFRDAVGYIEKDWGEAFPESWIWMQCNDEETSLMCAIASIPWGIFHFTGLICVLLADGKQYRFATYNGARTESLQMNQSQVTVVIKRGKYRLRITADNERFSSLKAPTKTGMDRDIAESIGAVYDIMLSCHDKAIFSNKYCHGGLEMLNPERMK